MTTTKLTDAIPTLRTYAGGLFDVASGKVNQGPQTPSSPPSSADQAAEQVAQKNLAKWQGQMTTALKQLDQAEDFAAKQAGREAFEKIAETATNVCKQIDTLVQRSTTDTDANARMHVLAEVLTALAAIAPSEIWDRSTKTTDNNGGT